MEIKNNESETSDNEKEKNEIMSQQGMGRWEW